MGEPLVCGPAHVDTKRPTTSATRGNFSPCAVSQRGARRGLGEERGQRTEESVTSRARPRTLVG